MNGAPPLSQTLLAGMRPQMPMQPPPQQPQGGLAQAGNPQMAKQGTDMALAAQNREEMLEPGLNAAADMGYRQYANQLMQRLQASLPSVDAMRRAQTARGLMMQNVLETLQPKERSGMDTLMEGVSSYDKPIMQGDLGAALASMGRGATAGRKEFEKNEQAKAMASYDLMDKEIDQQQKLMTDTLTKQKMLTGVGTPEFSLPDGTPVFKSGTRMFYVGNDGKPVEWLGAEKTIVGGDTLYGRRAAMVEMLAKEYLERGDYKTLEEATRAAETEANRLINGVSRGAGVAPRPMTPAAGTPRVELPTTAPQAAPTSEPRQVAPEPSGVAVGSAEGFELLRKMMNEASRSGDRQKFDALLREMRKEYPNGRPVEAQSPQERMLVPQVAGTQKKSARLSEGEKGYGGEEGKALFKERDALSSAYQANTALSSQLDLLEKLYSDPNIPEGKLGPAVQGVRSSLKSLGVDVGDEVGAADLANALAQKLVLGIRTADGTNLLPGAISNFEVQLLQSMGPTLGMTAEGRRALIAYMKDVAKSQQRLSEEATKFESAEGRLTPGWYKRKERVILEEQARRTKKLREIASQFRGPI